MEVFSYLLESMMQVGFGLFGWIMVAGLIYLAVKIGEFIADAFGKLIKFLDPKGGQ